MSLADHLAIPLSYYPTQDDLSVAERRQLTVILSDFYSSLCGRQFDWEAKPLRWRHGMRHLSELRTGWQSWQASEMNKSLAQIAANLTL